MRRLVPLLVLAAAVAAVAAGVRPVFVFGPLLTIAVLAIGAATFRSLDAGADHIPSEDPTPVDPRDERTVYWCAGCGAEVLLLVRGTPLAPRHCGEKMTERVELPGRGPAA